MYIEFHLLTIKFLWLSLRYCTLIKVHKKRLLPRPGEAILIGSKMWLLGTLVWKIFNAANSHLEIEKNHKTISCRARLTSLGSIFFSYWTWTRLLMRFSQNTSAHWSCCSLIIGYRLSLACKSFRYDSSFCHPCHSHPNIHFFKTCEINANANNSKMTILEAGKILKSSHKTGGGAVIWPFSLTKSFLVWS